MMPPALPPAPRSTLLALVTDPTSPAPRGKRATRQAALARRDALSAEVRAAHSAAIARAVCDLLAARFGAGAVIALYEAKGSEVDTTGLHAGALHHGFVTAYPRIVDHDHRLAFHRGSPAELVPSPRFGLREPRPDAPTVALDEISAFVIPGLAYDRQGGRIGWGRGYYDATLAAVPGALRIGVGFACQLVDRVPRDPHDEPVHVVITEAQTLVVA